MPGLIIVLLALLTAVGPISTDMYLPAFPAMKAELMARPGEAQITLAAWFLGLSVGQITHGPLSDHYGRRVPLLLGTALYTIASIGCAMAPSMTILSCWRLVAAFGGAASLVIPRAVIRDMVLNGVEAARLIGRLTLVMGVVPILAPTAGGFIAEHLGWEAIFWVAAFYGVLCSLLIWRYLPDTLLPERHVTLSLVPTLLRYRKVWRDRVFRYHALEGGCGTFSLFAFLGGAPTVFLGTYHLSPTLFGSVFISNATGYIIGVQVNARAVRRYRPGPVLTAGACALAVTTSAMLVLTLTGIDTPLALTLCMMACMTALGFVLPGAAIGCLLPHAAEAGSASALYGTTVFFIGAFSTVLVGEIGRGSPVPMAALMVLGAIGTLLCDRQRPRRARRGSRRNARSDTLVGG
ncbi:multidrug effflux MFS transporter [Lichenicoccus roseus]|nr:multidrug effflux MFS transporter [Lichenicoccus roseus]